MKKTLKLIMILVTIGLLMAFMPIKKITIKNDWGTIELPINMEVQSGYYKTVNDSVKMKAFGRTDLLVFQQKGLNDFNEDSFGNYARILFNADDFPRGLSSINNTIFTKKILDYLKTSQKKVREKQFVGTNTFISKFSDISILDINGEKCIYYSYTRTSKGNTPVNCSIYMFHKKYKSLIIQTEYNSNIIDWKDILENTVRTFSIKSSNN